MFLVDRIKFLNKGESLRRIINNLKLINFNGEVSWILNFSFEARLVM